MDIFNRRNAIVGWLVWAFLKQVAHRKAKSALSGPAEGGRLPKRSLLVLGLAGAGAAAAYLWLREGEGDEADAFG